MMLTISPMQPGDHDALATLFEHSVRHSAPGHYSPQQVEAWAVGARSPAFLRELAASEGWVAWLDENRVGFVTLTRTAHLGLLYVAPDHQRQGIGEHLVITVLASARERGWHELQTEASLLSLGLFLRLGFRVTALEQIRRGSVLFSRHRLRYRLSSPVGSLQ